MGYEKFAYNPYLRARFESDVKMQKGDRVRIKEGYDGAGDFGFYEAKMNDEAGKVFIIFDGVANFLLADAIEPYPYTREERIERAIEDFTEASFPIINDFRALLFAIMDAGV